jgi:hypothetical protein
VHDGGVEAGRLETATSFAALLKTLCSHRG